MGKIDKGNIEKNFKDGNSLSRKEIKKLDFFSSNPKKLDEILAKDHDLKGLKEKLLKEKKGYDERSKKSKSKEWVDGMINTIVGKIDKLLEKQKAEKAEAETPEKAEAKKVEIPKAEPVVEIPKAEPVVEIPKAEAKKPEKPEKGVEAKKVEIPKAEPVVEIPEAEAKTPEKAEAKKVEIPKAKPVVEIPEVEAETPEEKKLEQEFKDLFKVHNTLFDKINSFFISGKENKEYYNKVNNLYKVYKTLTSDHDKLEIFQKYMNLKYKTGLKVDGKWGKHSKQALDKYLTENEDITLKNVIHLKNSIDKTKKQGLKNFLSGNPAKKIDQTTENEIIKEFQEEFPTIDSVKDFLDTIRDLKHRKAALNKQLIKINKKKHKDTDKVTIKYAGHTDEMTVKDLKGILKAIDFNINSDTKGVKNAKNGKVDYNSIAEYAQGQIDKKELPKGLEKLLVTAKSFMGVREGGKGLKHKKLKDGIIKLTGINIDGGDAYAWCAAFIRYVLSKSGYEKQAKRMNNSAVSALGLPFQTGHIGIYEGGGKMISGNSNNRVRVSGFRINNLIGYIMPEDVGLKGKAHKPKSIREIPIGALLVFKRGSVHSKQKETKKTVAKRKGAKKRLSSFMSSR